MRTVCPSCATSIEIDYTMLGASVVCETCKQIVVPNVEIGTHFPATGISISFGDFVRLVTYGAYRAQTLPVVRKWAPEIDSIASEGSRIAPGGTKEQDLIAVHKKIQNDPAKQAALYNIAMSLWR